MFRRVLVLPVLLLLGACPLNDAGIPDRFHLDWVISQPDDGEVHAGKEIRKGSTHCRLADRDTANPALVGCAFFLTSATHFKDFLGKTEGAKPGDMVPWPESVRIDRKYVGDGKFRLSVDLQYQDWANVIGAKRPDDNIRINFTQSRNIKALVVQAEPDRVFPSNSNSFASISADATYERLMEGLDIGVTFRTETGDIDLVLTLTTRNRS